jgi:hypothetical protein
MKLASPGDLMLIFLAVLSILYFTLPTFETVPKEDRPQGYLFSAWLGNLDLNRVFWPFFILLNASLYTSDILAKSSIFTVSTWDAIHFILIFPICWWTIAIWRCSKHSKTRIWSAVTRLITIAVFFDYALKLAIRIDYPRIFFSCEELMLDYGNCF